MTLPHYNLIFAVLTNTLFSAMPVGYELIVLNAPQTVLEKFVNFSYNLEHRHPLSDFGISILWSFIVACQALGAVFGCFLIVPLLDSLGRRFCLMILNNILVITGSLLMGLSDKTQSFEVLILGRLILGLSTGAIMTTLPIWVSEIAPHQFRGMFSCFQHTFLTLGCAAGAFLGLEGVLGNESGWGYLLGMPLFAGIMQIALYPLFPETPKFLLIHREDEDRAFESIHYYHGPESNAAIIATEIETEFRHAIKQEGLAVAVKVPRFRSRLLLGALSNFAQIFTGLMAIVSYSTDILTAIGLPETSSQYVTAVGAVVFAVISLPAIYLVEKFGRRPLLLSSLAVITVSDFGFFVFGLVIEKTEKQSHQWAVYLFIICIFLFAIAYNLGPGPIGYFISAELAFPSVRMVTLAVGVAINWLSTVISVFIFYPFESAAGSFSFLLFAVPTLVNFCVLFWKLPETKAGRDEHFGYQTLPQNEVEVIDGVVEQAAASDSSSNDDNYGTFEPTDKAASPIIA